MDIDTLLKRKGELDELIVKARQERELAIQEARERTDFEKLEPSDYDELLKRGFISQQQAEALQKLDSSIQVLRGFQNPTAEARDQLMSLVERKIRAAGTIQQEIINRRHAMEEQRANLERAIEESYRSKVEQYEGELQRIMADPNVDAALKRRLQRQQEEAKGRQEQVNKKILADVKFTIQNLQSVHDKSLAAIGRVRVDKGRTARQAVEGLLQALLQASDDEGKGKERRRDERREWEETLKQIRKAIIEHILMSQDPERIMKPQQMAPREIETWGHPYSVDITFLASSPVNGAVAAAASNTEGAGLLEQRRQILALNRLFRDLFGQRGYTDQKTGKKVPPTYPELWRAFELRSENDKNGVTEELRQARKERMRKEVELRAQFEKIIHCGGFLVQVPQYRKSNNQLEIIETLPGAVRLERVTTKKGNHCWKVVEVGGAADGVIRVGQTSDLTMSQFSECVRDAAETIYTKWGEEFV